MKKLFVYLLIILSSSFLFASITIEEAEEMMMRNNPSIRSAEEAVVQAGLDLKDSKANFSPTIELSGSMTYMTEPIIGPVIMESSDILSQMGLGSYADSASGYVTLYDGMENTMYMGSLSLTQPLITWGKLGKAVDLYQNILTAQSLRKDDTVAQLKAELRVRVWSLKYLNEMNAHIDEASTLSKELVDIAKSGYKDDPYVHYVNYGKKEGRLPIPPIPKEYKEADYLELNPDIAKVVAEGKFSSGIDHYIQYGFKENRKVSK